VPGEFELIAPEVLRPHEDIDAERLDRLVEEIRTAGAFYPPILVDRDSRVILDGHHRWRASARLGFVVVPCYSVDYLDDPTVRVMSRRSEIEVTKQSVLDIALSDGTYPRKTTRHMYDLPEWIEPVPLGRLLLP
jgi:ParB-like chromosome segregation protein Spo0J